MIQLNLTRREIHLIAAALSTRISETGQFKRELESERYDRSERIARCDVILAEHKKLRATLLELVK